MKAGVDVGRTEKKATQEVESVRLPVQCANLWLNVKGSSWQPQWELPFPAALMEPAYWFGPWSRCLHQCLWNAFSSSHFFLQLPSPQAWSFPWSLQQPVLNLGKHIWSLEIAKRRSWPNMVNKGTKQARLMVPSDLLSKAMELQDWSHKALVLLLHQGERL